ncbi:WD40 repeat-like protein [Lophium mytilinum]|uniref:WD40 repeat-like protein n=1 Tax=Lophium mytilinum TaxID=390894 RepID=A0A6A6QEF0_9PEZI|nr:WD40 repeat-like protein [Lophium mytilinum]
MHGFADDDALREYMPMSFGKQARTANIQAQFDLAKRKVVDESKQPPAKGSKPDKGSGSDDSEDDDDDDDDSEEEDEFPVSHELLLKTHERAVTTATLDASGSRMVTGSNDCTLNFHDFAAMTPTTVRAFKTVDPSAAKSSTNSETHPINQILFNPHSANQILVITAQPQAKLFTRDGEQVLEFVKGDPYLRDMHNTKGHISEIKCGAWHPTNRDVCVTGGTDSTIRIWDVNNKREQRDVIVHRSRAAGSAGRTRITALAWGSQAQGGNSLLVAAALDGSLVMYSGEGPYHRPAAEIRDAHVNDTWTGGLDISADGRLVVTRGGDDTIKLWDTRKFKSPITTVSHESTSSQYPTSNIRFSPTSSSVITGSATGDLHILNPATLRPELVTPVTLGSPLITVLWHPKLNQIITGSGNAETHVLFNPNTSNGGAKTVMSKAPKRRHIDDDPNLTMDLAEGLSGDSIITPGGMPGTNTAATSFSARHPTIGLTASGKSRDPRRPHIPATTPFAKTNPDEKHIRDHIPLSSMRDEDPREALLKYADKAKNDPLFTNAWKHTQPVTLYGELSDEEEEPEAKKAKR